MVARKAALSSHDHSSICVYMQPCSDFTDSYASLVEVHRYVRKYLLMFAPDTRYNYVTSRTYLKTFLLVKSYQRSPANLRRKVSECLGLGRIVRENAGYGLLTNGSRSAN